MSTTNYWVVNLYIYLSMCELQDGGEWLGFVSLLSMLVKTLHTVCSHCLLIAHSKTVTVYPLKLVVK